MAGTHRSDRAALPEDEQERRTTSLSHGNDAADPSAAAVIFAERPSDGRGLDRGAHHAPLCGIEMISDRIPDETTILAFHHLLEKHKLGEQIFETVKCSQKNPVAEGVSLG